MQKLAFLMSYMPRMGLGLGWLCSLANSHIPELLREQLLELYTLHIPRGGRKNKTRKRRISAPARKKRHVRTFFFLVRFWAFLGKGSSKTRDFF
jgi:hypothetical protein